jgi:pantetheine-phosphate adenylyltransferase
MKRGLFAGSFDPPTFGHIDIIIRAASLFDELLIGVAINSEKAKTIFFSTEEKKALLNHLFSKYKNIKIYSFNNLVVDFARQKKVTCLIRALRSTYDLDFELKYAVANKKMSSLETLFLMADPKFSQISSRLVREIASLNGSLNHFVPKIVIKKIKAKS